MLLVALLALCMTASHGHGYQLQVFIGNRSVLIIYLWHWLWHRDMGPAAGTQHTTRATPPPGRRYMSGVYLGSPVVFHVRFFRHRRRLI